MLYHLFTYLDRVFDFPGAGMFNYAWMTLVRQGKAGLPTSGSVSALPTSRYVKYPSTYPAHAFKRSEVQW